MPITNRYISAKAMHTTYVLYNLVLFEKNIIRLMISGIKQNKIIMTLFKISYVFPDASISIVKIDTTEKMVTMTIKLIKFEITLFAITLQFVFKLLNITNVEFIISKTLINITNIMLKFQ